MVLTLHVAELEEDASSAALQITMLSCSGKIVTGYLFEKLEIRSTRWFYRKRQLAFRDHVIGSTGRGSDLAVTLLSAGDVPA